MSLIEATHDAYARPSAGGASGGCALSVERHLNADVFALLAPGWNALAAGNPFRSSQWLGSWWRHYGGIGSAQTRQRELYLLTVRDESHRLLAVAPWYVERSLLQGRVLRPLGSGEVCSEYLGVLCHRSDANSAGRALGAWLATHALHGDELTRDSHAWDLAELLSSDPADACLAALRAELADRGCLVHERPGVNCWSIDLPRRWPDYLASLSKSHRKQLRGIERRLAADRGLQVWSADTSDRVEQCWTSLLTLHERRRASQGELGRFGSARFRQFHREAIERLWPHGQATLHCLEQAGKPLAVEYHLAGGATVYAYQSGIEPTALRLGPGQIITATLIRQAIERGDAKFDFLRGDEPYKAHWRAAPRATLDVRIAAGSSKARLRHGLWLAGDQFRHWFRGGLKRSNGDPKQSS